MNRLKYILSLAVILAAPLLSAPMAKAAGSATLYLSPSSGTIRNGNSLAVAVYENSGATVVNGVTADMSFDRSLLNVTNIANGPAWSIFPGTNGYNNSAGTITFTAACCPGPGNGLTGAQLVATVTFKAVASSGSAAVTFNSHDAITASDGVGTNVWNGNTAGGTYTLAPPISPPPPPPPPPPPTPPPPAPTPPPSHPPSPPAAHPGTPSPSPAPKKAPSGLKITDVTATDIGADSATITWTTSAAANSEVDYGPDVAVYGLSASDANPVTAHKIVLHDPKTIQPGVTYHFIAKSTDASGTASSADFSFTTKGAKLEVTILNQNGKPVSGAKVSLIYPTTTRVGEQTISADTNDEGKATLTGSPVGVARVTVAYHGKTTTFNNIQVKPIDPKNPTQSLSFKIKASNISPLVYIIPLLLVVLLAAILLKRRAKKPNDPHFPDMPAPTPTGSPSTPGGSAPSGGSTIIRPTITSGPSS